MQDQQQRHFIGFCFLANPTDVIFGDKVHDGIVMKYIAQYAYACPVKRSAYYRVTV
jgi:acyl-CoA hydrolase